MSKTNLFLLTAVCVLALFGASALAAGGDISGIVKDTKGAVIPGATVTLISTGTTQPLTVTTDGQGTFKFNSVAAGDYVILVAAKGFADLKREGVTVVDGKSVKLEFKLEPATVTAELNVSASSIKPNSDPRYQRLRLESKDAASFSGPYATVTNLVLQRDAAQFTLRSGEIYFLAPEADRTVAAVFIGGGEVELTPPTDTEKKALAIFTNGPGLKEEFNELVLRFTDKTFEEIKGSAGIKMGTGGSQASKARSLFHDKETLQRKTLRSNIELRTLNDLYSDHREGFFMAFINGRRFSKLFYVVDPLGITEVSPEEVALVSYGDSDGGIWTAFHLANEYKTGLAVSSQDRRQFDITHHDIDAVIKGTRITATDTLTLKTLVPDSRVLPFDLFRTLRVTHVQDEKGTDLNFVQESKDEDADFAVILPEKVQPGTQLKLIVQYDGEGAIRDSGEGNFILLPRSTWYPNNAGTQFGDRATFDMTMHFPKKYMFVGVGTLSSPETVEGDMKVAKWTSGSLELAVAGFNFGDFKKKELVDADTGYGLEFFANNDVPAELKAYQMQLEQAESRGVVTGKTLGSISTTRMGDMALADAENATRIYTNYFGKLPYSRIAMTQQPAINFGQAWPTLVFMPYTAYIDTTQRTQLFGMRGGTDNFWRYVAPHEIAHQWWGHMVGWDSYHDQWMSEGFAEFSASLYVQYVRHDVAKFIEFWEDQRKLIIEASPRTMGKKPYTVGPVTQGYRLNNAKTGNVARAMIYPKGAFILHMIRMMMYDRQTQDARFKAMMTDFIKTNFNKDISTENFKQVVEKHMTKSMDLEGNHTMDWFFNEYVYGTEMPRYQFTYEFGSANGKTTFTGHLTQSEVSDSFEMVLPIYADFGKGWVRLGTIPVKGNTTADIKDIPLPEQPKRMAICAMEDVLGLGMDSKKR